MNFSGFDTPFSACEKEEQNQKEAFFYLNYLHNENHLEEDHDPHTRLTHFHLAIIEQLGYGHNAIAYQIYLDLVAKKEAFLKKDYHFDEEIKDLFFDIVISLEDTGYPVSLKDFQ